MQMMSEFYKAEDGKDNQSFTTQIGTLANEAAMLIKEQ